MSVSGTTINIGKLTVGGVNLHTFMYVYNS